ncbi:hypothetical protein BDK51DRAFT_33172, partial [Blyttiomyces helicus]
PPIPHSSIPDIHRKPAISHLTASGAVHFVDDSVVENVDAIILATGYLYDYPYLRGLTGMDADPEIAITTDGRGLRNVYQHVFYIPNPTLCVVGTLVIVEPFPLFEFQARLITHHLRNSLTTLPSAPEMRASEEAENETLGIPAGDRRKTVMGPERQYAYWDAIAKLVGVEGTPEGRRERREEVVVERKARLGY